MIADLKRYGIMNDSGLPWLGEVPGHWEVRRLKYLVQATGPGIQMGPFGASLTQLESHDTGFKLYGQENTISGDFSKGCRWLTAQQFHGLRRYELRAGDLAWTRKGSIGKCRIIPAEMSRGIADSDTIRVRLNHNLASPEFVVLLLHEAPYVSRQIESVQRGAILGGLNTSTIANLRLAVPPHSEQAAIVRFLDHADGRIRRYIRAKQQLSKLLAELVEVLTRDACQLPGTRRLRIGSAADRVERPIDRQDNQFYTPIGLYNRGRGIFHKQPTQGSGLGDSSFFWVAQGDLVLSGQFAWEGAIALAGPEDHLSVASHRYPVLRGKPEIAESAYLLSFFRTGWGRLLLDHHSRGAAGRNRPLNAASLLKESVPIPPLPVQRQIAALIHFESRIRHAVASQVALLREYRTRVIADVVTGKVDVREPAANLPDQGDEPKEVGDTEALIEDDEDIADGDDDAAPEKAEA